MTDPIKAKIQELCPDLMELKFGCEIHRIFWYKSEADKKAGKIDWMETGHYEDGRRGTIIKDLRKSDYLPMWIDFGDQLEFNIGPDDIVSFEILGRPITLADVLRAIMKANFDGNQYDAMCSQQCVDTCRLWILDTDNYDGQTRETQKFIGSILNV